MVVDSAAASLRRALQQKPQGGCHSILLKGRSIIGFTPNELESVWLYTGLFVPPLAVDEEPLEFGRGVDYFWGRTCLWFFCSQTAMRDINDLVKYCEKRFFSEYLCIDWLDISSAGIEGIDDTSCKFAPTTSPEPVSYLDELTPAEKTFMGGCDVRIPRTLFHLSFWYV